jgi:hypothetical protein
VALNERITLKWRKALATFVPLGLPHAHDRIGASVPEAIEESRVVSEMVIQNCPLSSDRCFHGAKSLPLLLRSGAKQNGRIAARLRRSAHGAQSLL